MSPARSKPMMTLTNWGTTIVVTIMLLSTISSHVARSSVSAFTASINLKQQTSARRRMRIDVRSLLASVRCEDSSAVDTHAASHKLMQHVLTRVRDVNSIPDDIRKSLLDFCVFDSTGALFPLGKVRPKIAKLLCSIQGNSIDGPAFTMQQIDQDANDETRTISQPFLTLTESCGDTYESRTAAVAAVTLRLKHDGVVTGWRDELYPISRSFYEPPVFAMERAAVSFLGALEYGVHINGLLVQSSTDEPNDAFNSPEILMWMARRSASKSKYPGMLDHIAAGGQPVGLSLMDNVVKECWEEAGIPPEISRTRVRPAGAISYMRYSAQKDVVERCVLFCYDLYLPADFQPQPMDGEVQEFFLYTIDQLLAAMDPNCTDPIKPNCYSVIIDFLLRHGYLSPELPGYLDVLRELRSGDCQ